MKNLNSKKQNHTSHSPLHTSQKGITLIALIITIIVMLILVGVTVNVALNGGLFSKAEEATTKTKISQIQEALAIKEAELIAEEEGVIEKYTLTLDKLDLPSELINEFSGKLIIGTDGKLYYGKNVKDVAEQNLYKSMGIQPYLQTPPPPGTGLKMDVNANYVYFNPDITVVPFIMNLTNDGYITVKMLDMTIFEEKVSEKLDTETGKLKGDFSIPGGISGEAVIWTNNEDDNDTNVYAEMLGETAIFEKKEIIPKEEINVYTGEAQGVKMYLVQISETEAIIKIGNTKPEKAEITVCSKLNELEGLETFKLDEDDIIPYSKVANEHGEASGAVYYDVLDVWYIFGHTGDVISIVEGWDLERDTTLSEEEIQAIINEANAETN